MWGFLSKNLEGAIQERGYDFAESSLKDYGAWQGNILEDVSGGGGITFNYWKCYVFQSYTA